MKLMNPHTGVVLTKEEWENAYKYLPIELWGGKNFEDAELIEVVWNEEQQQWEELD